MTRNNFILTDDEKILDLLLKGGVKVNAMDNNNWTALHWAARMGNEKIAALLIERGAGVNLVDNNGDTPLNSAITFGIFSMLF